MDVIQTTKILILMLLKKQINILVYIKDILRNRQNY